MQLMEKHLEGGVIGSRGEELVRSLLMNQSTDKRNIRRFGRDHLIVGVSDEETQADQDSEDRLRGGAVHPVPTRGETF